MSQIRIQRIDSVEWLRFFAALGIVWFHTNGAWGRSIGYAGLPIFLLVFCSLIVINFKEIGFTGFLRRRTVRLLIPWVFWSIVYGFVRVIKFYWFPKTSLSLFSSCDFLVGGSMHLWYLPFAFLVSLILFMLCRYTTQSNHIYLSFSFAFFLSIGCLYLCSYIMKNYSIKVPFVQWLFVLPSIPMGYFLGSTVRFVKPPFRLVLLSLLLAAVCLVCLSLFWLGNMELVVPYGIGVFLTVLAYNIPFPFAETSRRLGSLTYGIYLIHPLVMTFVVQGLHFQMPLIKIISTFSLSAIIVYVFKNTIFRYVL
jgi:peptidoglycan/LPS O-acetylase OafA/YrhL